ncbi:hypothetical protein [Micromonospora sp. NPDC092111]|uniref:hypothetical protein n=1 Tax=Micromonospora sp. NPDC092111 TaxID=3364289 RepID=UPI00381B83F8
MLTLVKITVIAGLLTGCSATGPGAPAPSPATPARTTGTAGPTADTTPGGPTAAARLTLTRSGGFAGHRDTVTVEPDGGWTTTDRTGATRTGRLDPADLDRLRALADTATQAGAGSPAASQCADTYRYRLSVGARSVDWTDCPTGPRPDPAAPALAQLLLDRTAVS